LEGSTVRIDTGTALPVWVRQYPIAQGRHEAVSKRVQEWLSYGWIVPAPSNCQWNIPLVAAEKPSSNGGPPGVRVCLDARLLNNVLVTEIDSNLPGCREILDSLGKFEWISRIDLADCYHQFELAEEDRVKTAFTWDGLQYMFAVVPIGLRIMTGHVQRLLELALGRTGRKPFQDDVGVASGSAEQHVSDVLSVLEILTYKANLRLRLEKCLFFRTEVPFLGHLITRTGIKMDPKKVKSITNWLPPVDGKAMQRFLGAANFNREFSHEFALKSAPLEACRLVKGPIEWTEECLAAFEAIKDIFKRGIHLRHVDWSATMYLTTDASIVGLGAWIGQKDEWGQIMPVVCVSKKLSPTQQHWSATKRELYGLMWAMQKLRMYLLGRKFVARVDHKPLVSMVCNQLSPMLEGWFDNILLFDFVTEYLPGVDNTLADALSRSYDVLLPTLQLCGIKVQPGSSGAFKQDSKVSTTALDSEVAAQWQAIKRGKVIPLPAEQVSLVEQTHALGHFSSETMFRKLWKQGYWWPGIRPQLKRFVSSCLDCLRIDIKQEGFHPGRSVDADKPWDHVQLDLIGPVPTSVLGNSWILTTVDVMSGYTILRALQTKGMEEVARALLCIMSEYGTMKILQSDNGSEFVNQVLQNLTQLYGIDQRLITPYNPRCDGQVENKNKQVGRILKKNVAGSTNCG
jgi:hypothetical protein